MSRPDPLELARFRLWLDQVDATEFETWEDLTDVEQDAATKLAHIIHWLMVHNCWSRSEVLGLMEGTLDALLSSSWADSLAEPEKETYPGPGELPR